MSERLPPASEPSGDAQGARHPHASHGGSRTLRRLCPGSGAPSKCSACKHMRGSGAVGLLCGTLRRRYTSETELQLTRAISIIRSCSEHERLGSRVCAGSMLVQARGRSVVAAMDSRTQRRGRSVELRWNQEHNETKRAQNRNMQLQTVYWSAGLCSGRRARLKGVASGGLQVLQLQGQVGHEALPGHPPPPPHGSRPLPGARLLHGRPTGAMSASSGGGGETSVPDHQTTRPSGRGSRDSDRRSQ